MNEWKSSTRTMTCCSVVHDCGGRCFMLDLDGIWRHHCDQKDVCRLPLMHDTNKDPAPDHKP